MNWTLFWQVAGPIIGLLGLSFAIWLFFFSHREKIVIKDTHMLPKLETDKAFGIKFEYSFSLLYVRGARDCYVSEIWLEFDKHSWKKLWPYFKIPMKLSMLVGQDGLPKLEIGKPKSFGQDDFFPAREVTDKKQYEELANLVQELWHRYRIGWKDTYGKTRSQKVDQLNDLKRLFKEAI